MFIRNILNTMPFIALAVAIAAALGGGATLAANNSLPGDALWSYKVHVNEGLRTTFAGSAEAKADTHIDAIRARVQETERVAAEGRLTAQANASISANFDFHTQAVAEAIAKLEAKGNYDAAADVAARYQAAVAAHAAALAQAQARAEADASSDVDLSPLILKVRTALDEASEMSAEASANAAVEVSL